MNLVSVPQAAERLGVSPERIYQRIKTGSLPAQRVGRSWVLDEEDVRRIAHHAGPGRPLSAASAWGLLAVSEGEAREFSSSARSRARARYHQLLRAVGQTSDLDLVAALLHRALGGRAQRRLYRASPLDLPALREDPRLHLSGLSAPGAQMSAGDLVEGYVRENEIQPLEQAHVLTSVTGARANVILHVIHGGWDVNHLFASDLLLAADLAEYDGTREGGRAYDLVEALVARDEQLTLRAR